jgi:hypothetical protein
MPKPRSGERKDDFINRCMGDDAMVADFEATGQRFAVCLRQWETRSKDEKGEENGSTR